MSKFLSTLYLATLFVAFFIILASITAPVFAGSQLGCRNFDSRLEVGDSARMLPGPPNNVRSEPDISADRVGRLQESQHIEIIGGPVCADDYIWWEIRRGNLEGWTVEGTPDEYWLAPMRENNSSGPKINRYADEDLENLLAGISYFAGGGGSGVVPCLAINVPADNPIGYYFPSIQENYDIYELEDNSTVIISHVPPPVDVESLAGICSPNPTSGILVSPEFDEETISYIERPNVYEFALPKRIYIEPGNWILIGGGFVLNIIVDLESPEFIGYGDGLWVVGFEPAETVALVSVMGEFNLDNQLVSIDDVLIETFQTDQNGSVRLPKQEGIFNVRLVAAIGDQGSTITDSSYLPACVSELIDDSIFCQIAAEGSLSEYLYHLIWVEE